MKYTEKYGFMKPDVDEFYDVNVFNENMNKVEEELVDLDGRLDKAEEELINLNELGSNLEEFEQEIEQKLEEKMEELDEKIENISKSFTGTLLAGKTEIIFTDNVINESSTIDIYSSVYGVSPKNMTISGHTLTLTFKAQDVDVDVKVVIS